MIQPNELRLLNWVKYDNRYFQIHSIAYVFPTLNTDEFGIGVVDYNNIQPIELTPDILEAAGFDSENYMFIKDVFDSRIAICYDYGDRQCGVGFSQRHMFWTNCKYLHQLQNLYWCLCGQELQIDITKLNKEK